MKEVIQNQINDKRRSYRLGKKEYDLLKDLKKLDTAREKNLSILINDVVKDERFIDKDRKVNEPFKTFLILKLLGIRPVRSLLMLNYILGKGQIVTRSDLASFLGSEFKEGSKYVEIGRWLECLEKLQVLEGCEVTKGGRKTKGFRIQELELHLCCETLQSVLDGKGVDWSQLDAMRIIARKFDPEKKIRDFVGTEIEFKPLDLIGSIIKSDVNFKNAFSITAKVSKEIGEGTCRDIQTIHKIVIDELEKISSSAARKYLKDNPPRIILTGEGYEGMTLNYDVVGQILKKYLLKYKLRYLSPKMRESMINSILRKFMISVKKSRDIGLEEILHKINTAIFDFYGNTLHDITANPQQCIQRAYLFLSSAKDKMEISEAYKAIQPLQSSFSCCLTPLYLKLELLPANDKVSTISLTRDLMFPKTVQIAEDLEKLKNELQPVGKGLRELLTKEKVNLNDFQKSLECLLSKEIKQPEVDAEGKIREIDEEALMNNIDFTITFMEKFVPIVETIIKRP